MDTHGHAHAQVLKCVPVVMPLKCVSVVMRVVMRSPDRTLSEKDIAGVRARIVAALDREFGAVLR